MSDCKKEKECSCSQCITNEIIDDIDFLESVTYRQTGKSYFSNCKKRYEAFIKAFDKRKSALKHKDLK